MDLEKQVRYGSIKLDYLKDQFKLIVPDLPGSGESEMIDDMSMEGMAEVIKAIFDSEQNSQLSDTIEVPPSGGGGVLIGHSMGGYITLAFVKKHSSLLRGFGLFHSTAFPDSDEKKQTRKKGIEFIRKHGAFEFLKSSTPNLFSPNSKGVNPELIDVIYSWPAQLFSPWTRFILRSNDAATRHN